jgi:Protein of unknown function (DUF1553)
MLFCAGHLNLDPFGPPVVPPLTDEELSGLFGGKNDWPVTNDEAQCTRRGVYLFVKRTFPMPWFAAFDPPDLMTSCPGRLPTTVPAQALSRMNSRIAADQARAFAQRLRKECGAQPRECLERAWLLAFGRPISPPEEQRALAFLEKRAAELRASGQQTADAGRTGDKSEAETMPDTEALAELCLALFNANEFIYID